MKLSLINAFGFTLLANIALAQAPVVVNKSGGACLDKPQLDAVRSALKELDVIHSSPASLTTQDPIIVIHDWQGRVYVNGGSTKPLLFKLKLGDTVDRDMAVTLTTQVYYRDKPADPMFRLRIRAQAGILVPELARTVVDSNSQRFWDGGVALDFFHLGDFNTSAYVGVFSAGGGFGYDLTKNFGPYVGYSMVYDGFRSSLLTGVYFSIN